MTSPSKLRVVASAGHRVVHSRPIRTEYAGSGRVARASTIHCAIVAATKRLLSREYREAVVYDERGVRVAGLRWMPFGIAVHFSKKGVV